MIFWNAPPNHTYKCSINSDDFNEPRHALVASLPATEAPSPAMPVQSHSSRVKILALTDLDFIHLGFHLKIGYHPRSPSSLWQPNTLETAPLTSSATQRRPILSWSAICSHVHHQGVPVGFGCFSHLPPEGASF